MMGKRGNLFGIISFVAGFATLITVQTCTDFSELIPKLGQGGEEMSAGFASSVSKSQEGQSLSNSQPSIKKPSKHKKSDQANGSIESEPLDKLTQAKAEKPNDFSTEFFNWQKQRAKLDHETEWGYVSDEDRMVRGLVRDDLRPATKTKLGLPGAQLDVMIAFSVAPYGKGQVYQHLPALDDQFDILEVDLLKLNEVGGVNLKSRHLAGQPFHLVVSNSEYSRGALIELNGQSQFVGQYEQDQKREAHWPIYRMVDSNTTEESRQRDIKQGIIPLDELKIAYLSDAYAKKEIHVAHPYCVAINYPGGNGEYRNGALVVQAVVADRASSESPVDPLTGSARLDGSLLWEVALFASTRVEGCD